MYTKHLIPIILMVIFLSGCATHATKETSSTQIKPNNITEVNTSKNTNLDDPEVTIKLSQKNGRVIADVKTNWNGHQEGELHIHWTSPTKYCVDSDFDISQYKLKNDETWAYRTIHRNCDGKWTAEVIDSEGNVLASDSITATKP